jgi:DNA replication protein DnaC
MMVYLSQAGPFEQTRGGKDKWLDLPDGRSGWYTGELKVASCPCCRGNRTAEFLARNSGLQDQDPAVDLDGFKVSGQFVKKAAAREQAARLIAMGQHAGGICTFWGGYGCGKSHLLKAIVNGFCRARVGAQYRTMAGLLSDIREQFDNDKGMMRAEEMIASFQRVKVLCIDELERVNPTEWARETVFRLIDSRYDRPNLLTVLASNIRPEALAPEFGYIASRMSSGAIVEVPGPDVREVLGRMKA